MLINVIDEYCPAGHLVWPVDFPGAYTRGRTRDEAFAKLAGEIDSYCRWCSRDIRSTEPMSVVLLSGKASELHIEQADRDVIFEIERLPLTQEDYTCLKALAMRSAMDFLRLYRSVPDKLGTTLRPRTTFYGDVPLTAEEMYRHAKNVNSYYFGEIGVSVGNEPDIAACRAEGFRLLEGQPGYLDGRVLCGSYGEEWSLRKLLRRFVWHDRIHARAMYRMAAALCGADALTDSFRFSDRAGDNAATGFFCALGK